MKAISHVSESTLVPLAIEYEEIAHKNWQDAKAKRKSDATTQDERDPKPNPDEPVNYQTRYRVRELNLSKDFWDYVIGRSEGPFYFKVVISP